MKRTKPNKAERHRMKVELDTMEINGVDYVRADSVKMAEQAPDLDGMPCVIVRTYSAGVFAGYVESREGKEVILRKARRLWYWSGAASLSQLAQEGVRNPDSCKFPCEVDKVVLTEAIEILDCTAKAKDSIDGVAIWKQ